MHIVFTNKDLIFNDCNFSRTLNVENVSTSLTPPIANNARKIAGRDGQLFQSDTLAPRTIEITCRIIKSYKNRDSLDNILREISSKLVTRTEEKLIFRGVGDIYYYAKLDGDVDLKIYRQKNALIKLKFIAFDPVAYGKHQIIPIQSETNLYANGSYHTYPYLKIKMLSAVSYIAVTHNDTKEFVKINHKFNVGDEVIIDFKKAKIYINGQKYMTALDFYSDFFKLKPGSNKLIFTAGVSGTIEFDERWYY